MACQRVRSTFGGIAAAVRTRIRDQAPPVPYTSARLGLFGNGQFGSRDDGRERELSALGMNSTLFAIVNKTSVAVGGLDWHLYRKAKSGRIEDRTEVLSHPALDVWRKPNDFYTKSEFSEASQQHLDLTGEMWWVVESHPAAPLLPLGLWPVRPDRMRPVASVKEFISGYIYTGPDGEQVPLETHQVICTKMPNPKDPYRGMGPVQALLMSIDSMKYGIEWNRNFFANSAEPGGVIEVPDRLSDGDFNSMVDRWRESHQGISNAHRVAILEQGKWVERKFTQKDMQFAELINMSREIITEAFAFPRNMLGITHDINRANAETGKEVFSESITIPRADRFRDTLNFRFLPLFGKGQEDIYEWDYTDPSPDNEEQKNATLTAKSEAAATLASAGFYAPDVLTTVGLPPMVYGQPDSNPDRDLLVKLVIGAPTLAPLLLPLLGFDLQAPPEPAPAAPPAPGNRLPMLAIGRTALGQPIGQDAASEQVDLSPVKADTDASIEQLLAHWQTITAQQRQQLAEQIIAAGDSGDLASLASMTVDTATGAIVLLDAMVTLGIIAASRVVHEALQQGTTLDAVHPSRESMSERAHTTAGLLGSGLALSAGRAALLSHTDGMTGQQLADATMQRLDALTDAEPRSQLGAALHTASNSGRIETLRAGPEGSLYASEVNDANTCKPCAIEDGRFLGLTSDLTQVELLYPGRGGFVDCLGRERCRGTVFGVWRKGNEGSSSEGSGSGDSGGSGTPVEPVPPTLADHIHSGIDTKRELGGGMSAKTELVTFKDGSRAVRKAAKDGAERDPVESSDAEELAAMLAERIGLSAPSVHRVDSKTVYMSYIDGIPTADEHYDDMRMAHDVADSVAGRRLGLFDLMIANCDRNPGNWLIAQDGSVTPIDHGLSFENALGEMYTVDDLWTNITGPVNIFAHRLLEVLADETDRIIKGSRDYTAGDVQYLRDEFKKMRSEFVRLGRVKWYNNTLGRLDFMEEHAKGTVGVYA